jgi:hypothetical protein
VLKFGFEDGVYARCLSTPTLMIVVEEEPSPADALNNSDEDA